MTALIGLRYERAAGDRIWRSNEVKQHPRTFVLRAGVAQDRVTRPITPTPEPPALPTQTNLETVDGVLVVQEGIVKAAHSVAKTLRLLAAERFNDATDGWEVARARWVSYGNAIGTNPANFPHVVPGLRTNALYPIAAPTRESYTAPVVMDGTLGVALSGASMDAASAAWGWTEVT